VHLIVSGQINVPAATKVLFDGAISALHRHDRSGLPGVAARLAAQLGLDADEVAHLLCNRSFALLGTRRLLWPHGAGLQWNPQDALCVLGEITRTDPEAPTTMLSGEVWRVEPYQASTHPSSSGHDVS
jgi:hypothetical protein